MMAAGEGSCSRQTRKIGPMYSHIWHYIGPMYSQLCQCWANFPSLSGSLGLERTPWRLMVVPIIGQGGVRVAGVVRGKIESILNI